MARIAGVDLPRTKRIEIGLTSIYGIGRKRSVDILTEAGVSADIAEYARGSSGEPTQGAGAVAMLVERNPKLLKVHLEHIGSASAYRAVDFRKPVLRNIIRGKLNCHFQDLPVFNGKYSTTCYIDETLHALNDMYEKRGLQATDYLRSLTPEELPVAAVFLTGRPFPEADQRSTRARKSGSKISVSGERCRKLYDSRRSGKGMRAWAM